MSTKKTALVTGANKGIGYQITKRLAQEGYTVWLGSRDEARGKAAVDELKEEGLDVHLLVIDVSSDSSVTAAAIELAKNTSVLDALVNNAGIAVDTSPPSQISMDKVKLTFETNVFGAIRTIQAFLPLIKASQAGRIVNVSSILGSITMISDKSQFFYPSNGLAYGSSKSALNAITVSFSKELAPHGIKVNASHPGYVATNMTSHRGTRSTEEGAEIQVKLATLPADGPTGQFFTDEGVLPW